MSHPADLPDLGDLLERVHVVALPMRVRFRGVDVREAVLFEGPSGWGEFAPFTEYGDVEAARWLAAGIEAAYAGWPAPLRDAVPVNATVPAVGPDRVPEVLARFDGCTTAKVKVAEGGQTLSDDLDRVAAVRDAMGPSGRVRVDANGGWSPDEALEALGKLSSHGLEYAEQPCATVDELVALRRALARNAIDVPIAADESIRKAEDPARRRSQGCRRHRRGQGRSTGWRRPGAGGRRGGVDCLPSCPRPSTRASASRPGSPSRLRSPSSTTPAAWAPWASSSATSRRRRCALSTVS